MPWNTTDPTCTANLSEFALAAFVVCNLISGIATVSGNGLICFVIYKFPRLHTASNFFIACLAAADFSVGLIVNPVYIALTTTKTWVSISPLYKFENYMWMQTLVSTSFSLTAISVDRYVAVTSPFGYQKLVKKKIARWVIISIWGFSFLFASISCFVEEMHESKVWISSLTLTFFFPCAIMVYCNMRVFRIAQEQIDKIRYASATSTFEIKRKLRNHKASLTVGIIIAIFIVLFSPNLIFGLIEYTTKDPCQKQRIYRFWLWGILVAFSSSAVNPFVYAIRIKALRQACRLVVLRLIRKDPDDVRCHSNYVFSSR